MKGFTSADHKDFTKYILMLKLNCKRSLKAVEDFLIQ